MKKTMVVLLVLIMAVFTACSKGKEGDLDLKSKVDSGNQDGQGEDNEGNGGQQEVNSGTKFKIAIIQPVDHPSLNEIRESIIAEFKEQGYDESKISIDLQSANGDTSLLPTIYQNLISQDVDILIPIATSTAQSALAATDMVPIVFSAVSNPVEAGLVTSLDATTGNVTGVSDYIAVEEILDLALTLTPDIKTFGFVYNASEINSVTGIERARAYCDSKGIAYKEVTITNSSELQQSAASIVNEIDAFFTPIDNTVASAMGTYAQIGINAGLPIYVSADSMVADGGLATVGIDYTVLGKQTAKMAIRIMNGETIESNPIEQMTEYAKIINMETANHLDITIPENIKDEFVIINAE